METPNSIQDVTYFLDAAVYLIVSFYATAGRTPVRALAVIRAHLSPALLATVPATSLCSLSKYALRYSLIVAAFLTLSASPPGLSRTEKSPLARAAATIQIDQLNQ
jgi:hypothetical protein